MTEERIITERQEEALRLVHHNFIGLTETEAAERMGITQQAVSQLLAQVKKAAPQLFPILTKQEAKCYHYLTVEGWPPTEIAEYMGISEEAVYKTFRRCRDKGLSFPGAHGRLLAYNEDMDDGQITHKF